ncbi:VOC family protein [Propioniciclava soli]|uniref:VOC family protein n=1 Tax=Propioniciclava soli TaxID=2775081 RepID=A0ABZ3C5R9_9ACTN
MDVQELTAREFQAADGTADWRVIGRDAQAWFATPSHAAGAAMIRRIAESGAALDADLRARGVRVRLPRPGARFTGHELELARTVSSAAATLGLSAETDGLQLVQIGIDSQDASAVLPFWAEVLGHHREGDAVLRDPGRRLASVWFQEQDAPRPLRNRVHLDMVTATETARAALDAVPGHGGEVRQHNDFYATVADADGNEADLLPLSEGADRWPGADAEDWRLVFAAVASYPTRGVEQTLDLADAAAHLADEAGVALGIDAVDIPAVRRFWAAALGYVEDPRQGVTDLVHPHQLTMPFFLQELDPDDRERRAQRNRIHVDVFVPDDLAPARVDAALAAGGSITYDAEAPAWWTLVDPEGNEVCIAVSPGREERWGE